jgi:hypothetical protein
MDHNLSIPNSVSASGLASADDSTPPTTVEESRCDSVSNGQVQFLDAIATASTTIDANELAEKLEAVVQVTDTDNTTCAEVPVTRAISARKDAVTHDDENSDLPLQPKPTSVKTSHGGELENAISEMKLLAPTAQPPVKLPVPGEEEGPALAPLSLVFDPTKDDGFTMEQLLARQRLPRSPYERLQIKRAKARAGMSVAEIADMDASEAAARAAMMEVQKERDEEVRRERHAQLREFGRQLNAEYKGPKQQ